MGSTDDTKQDVAQPTALEKLKELLKSQPLIPTEISKIEDLLRESLKISGFLGVFWAIGSYGFSVLWVFLITGTLVFREIKCNERKSEFEASNVDEKVAREPKSAAIFHEFSTAPTANVHSNAPNKFKRLSRKVDNHKEVAFCEGPKDSADWISAILTDMWPSIGQFVASTLKTGVQSMIKQMEPSKVCKSFEFTRVNFGNHENAPKIKSVQSYRPVDQAEGDKVGMIYVDFEVEMVAPDVDVAFEVLGISLGIEDVVFKGICRLILSPLIDEPPFFGSMSIMFVEPPTLNFDLTGAAAILKIHPGLKSILHGVVDSVFASMFVLPSRMTVPMIQEGQKNALGEDMMEKYDLTPYDLMHPFAKGCIFVNVKRARDLLAKDDVKMGGFKLKSGKSDPYVEVKIGNQVQKTKYQKNDLNPVWNQHFSMCVVNPMMQKIHVKVWDDDSGQTLNSAPDFLGGFDLDVKDIYPGRIVGHTFPLEGPEEDGITGDIDIDFYWVPLKETCEDESKHQQSISCVVIENCKVDDAFISKHKYLMISIEDDDNEAFSTPAVMTQTNNIYQVKNYYYEKKENCDSKKDHFIVKNIYAKDSAGNKIAESQLKYNIGNFGQYNESYEYIALRYLNKEHARTMTEPKVRISVRTQRAVGTINFSNAE